MTEREFFRRTLGPRESWEITDVKLDLVAKTVVLDVRVAEGTKWAEQGRLLPIAGYEERRWRHLDTMQLETTIVALVPRVRDPNGRAEMVSVPWAQMGVRWISRLSRSRCCGRVRALPLRLGC